MRSPGLALLGVAAAAAASSNAGFKAGSPSMPHQIIVLVDDFGVGYPSWYRGNPLPLIHPEFDELENQSVILERAYTYRFCSPSRASLLTGRAGWRHVAAEDNLIPWTRQECIDRSYDMWPKRLKGVGYHTVQVGKWHQGLYADDCLPVARGFDESYGFISGGEDHFTQECFNPTKECSCRDLFNNTRPSEEPEGVYNTDRFTRYATDAIAAHASGRGTGTPFAMYLALQVTHAPVEAPAETVKLYNFSQELQSTFHAMVTEASRATGAVVAALRQAGMWDDAVVYVMGDNGSPVQVAGSNAELRGGKATHWEGGAAVPAFVTGGMVPEAARGTRRSGLWHFSDVYATLTSMAGLDPHDTPGPAPVDGIDMWPYISGAVPLSPRSGIVHDHWLPSQASNPFNVSSGSITREIGGTLYKLLTLPGNEASWYGWWSPNASCVGRSSPCFKPVVECSPTSPCLYDLTNDPGEHHNIAAAQPTVLSIMQASMATLDDEYHPPPPAAQNVSGYCEAIAASGGFLTPWRDQA